MAGDTEQMGDAPTRDPAERDPVQELAQFYELLADSEFAGYCPLYELLARQLAADPEILERFATAAPRAGLIPILLFACVHYLVLGEPESPLARVYAEADVADAWPVFRALVEQRQDELLHLMATRSVQTNEVGRSSGVLPALARVQATMGRPLALVELGPSAGLNLFSDQFRVEYRVGAGDGPVTVGPADSSVVLSCDVLGATPPPWPTGTLPIASRQGIDLNPLDVADDDQCRWLQACLWPGLPERAERLRAAIDLARRRPPTLHQGDLVAMVDGIVRSIDDDAVPCLISTWVLAYLSRTDRQRLKSILDVIGAERDLALITGEYPHVAAWVPEPADPAAIDDPRGASLLGIVTWRDGHESAEAAAWVHSHGRWLQWLPEATSSS